MKHPTNSLLLLPSIGTAAAVVMLGHSAAQAALLTPTYEAQLEAWLDQGNLTFTSIFIKNPGDDSFDFHAAADGQGATFTLMKVSGNGWLDDSYSDVQEQIIGGYNPQSWSSIGDYNRTYNDADRTAFIYNLTTSTIQRQNLSSQAGYGHYQTYNSGGSGPTFGGGHDLYSNNALGWGYAYNLSYGGTQFGAEILTGTPNEPFYSNPYYAFDITEMEVYTFATATAVPEAAGTLSLLGFGLVGLRVARRRIA